MFELAVRIPAAADGEDSRQGAQAVGAEKTMKKGNGANSAELSKFITGLRQAVGDKVYLRDLESILMEEAAKGNLLLSDPRFLTSLRYLTRDLDFNLRLKKRLF